MLWNSSGILSHPFSNFKFIIREIYFPAMSISGRSPSGMCGLKCGSWLYECRWTARDRREADLVKGR